MPDLPKQEPDQPFEQKKASFKDVANLFRLRGDADLAKAFDELSEQHDDALPQDHEYDVPPESPDPG